MARRKSSSSINNIFILVFSIAFGLLAIVLGYRAVTNSSDIRSRAEQTVQIYKQWEFTGSDSEGWSAIPPHTSIVRNGSLIVTVSKGNKLPAVRNSTVDAHVPPGLKSIQFSMAVGSVPTITRYPTPTICPPAPICTGQLIADSSTQTGLCPLYTCLPTPVTYQESINAEVQGVSTITEDSIFSQSVTTDGVCPIDVMLCPDGSIVGRSGSTCEFIPCPGIPPTTPRRFTALVYYQLTEKKKYEQPLPVSGVIDGLNQVYSVSLPDVNATNIAKIRIVFTSGIRVGERIAIDWIHINGIVNTY